MTDDEQLIGRLEELSGCFELSRVTTYKGFRHHKDGGVRDITIEVRDSGKPEDPQRWNVKATDKDGRMATGNGAKQLDEALLIVHWYDLDEDPID